MAAHDVNEQPKSRLFNGNPILEHAAVCGTSDNGQYRHSLYNWSLIPPRLGPGHYVLMLTCCCSLPMAQMLLLPY